FGEYRLFDAPQGVYRPARGFPGSSFKIGPTLGEGSFGSVRSITVTQANGTTSAYAVKIFKNEAGFEAAHKTALNLAQEFGNHPNFLKFYGAVQDGTGKKGLIYELGGKDLFDDFVGNQRPMSRFEVSNDFHDIIDGISYIHNQGKVHWDFKAENALRG